MNKSLEKLQGQYSRFSGLKGERTIIRICCEGCYFARQKRLEILLQTSKQSWPQKEDFPPLYFPNKVLKVLTVAFLCHFIKLVSSWAFALKRSNSINAISPLTDPRDGLAFIHIYHIKEEKTPTFKSFLKNSHNNLSTQKLK